MTEFDWFARPTTAPVRLSESPRLESWNAAAHPDQVLLHGYLDQLMHQLAGCLDAVGDPLALSLDVGLDASVPLLDRRDLDNYLLPVARRIQESGRRLVSVHGTKSHRDYSFVALEQARARDAGDPPNITITEVSVSYEREEYKRMVRDALVGAPPLPEGPVRLEIAFAIGSNRNWLALWKPTIDALGTILGHDPGASEWNARDGRITQLALHCHVDPARRWEVGLAISAVPLVLHPDPDDEVAVIEFALSFDAYADSDPEALAALTDDVEARWNATAELPADLIELRKALFFMQRRHRVSEEQVRFGELPVVRAILTELRGMAPSGLTMHRAEL